MSHSAKHRRKPFGKAPAQAIRQSDASKPEFARFGAMASATTHGREAATPTQIPARGWWDILKRTRTEAGNDNLGLVSAGVAFYAFLALVPMLGALVLTYGLVVDPAEVSTHMAAITAMMPTDAAKLIDEQLKAVVGTATSKKGWGLALALALAFYGAMKGAGAIVTALNIVYDEEEKRGFIKTFLINAAITLGVIVLAGALVLSGSLSAFLEELARRLSTVAALVIKVGAWLVTAALASAAVAALYRYAPSRDKAQWRWLSPGSIFATIGFVLATLGFGIYAAKFGNYNATYGSLGAIVVLLLWLYLSAYVLLLGAELNAELEHQTAKDTTSGADRPMGQRGARMADDAAAKD